MPEDALGEEIKEPQMPDSTKSLGVDSSNVMTEEGVDADGTPAKEEDSTQASSVQASNDGGVSKKKNNKKNKKKRK